MLTVHQPSLFGELLVSRDPVSKNKADSWGGTTRENGLWLPQAPTNMRLRIHAHTRERQTDTKRNNKQQNHSS